MPVRGPTTACSCTHTACFAERPGLTSCSGPSSWIAIATASSPRHPPMAESVPLFVDLDGTLLRTDLLHESLVRLLRQAPAQLWRAPLWLLRGKARFKHELAQSVRLDPTTLPY